MAYKIPVRFKRVAAVFDSEVARARLCDSSSGSEHSMPDRDETLASLSDLINSFIEKEGGFNVYAALREKSEESEKDSAGCVDDHDHDHDEAEEALKILFSCQADDVVKRNIGSAVENALAEVGADFSSSDFKRTLMSRLRYRGFDAGLCKSKWEKSGNCPSGSYEYIDVFMPGNHRYIIEVSMAKEFDIARPSTSYSNLLKVFPWIFVGKQEELKQITKLMGKSIRKSMKKAEIHVAPWRRLAYMQAKWFASYKRTVNEFPVQKALVGDDDEEELKRKRSVGFAPNPKLTFCYKQQGFAAAATATVGSKVGNLALALNVG